MTPLTWRPLEFTDLPALHAMFLAAATADESDRLDSLETLQAEFDDPWSNPAEDARLGLTAEGALAAYARCLCNPAPAAQPHVHLEYEVHPAWRGQGLEAELMRWLEARGTARLAGRPAGMLQLGLDDRQAERLALAQARGFTPLRYFYRMARDLTRPIPDLPLPAGLTGRGYTPELAAPLLAAHNEAFADHWEFEPVPPEEWRQFYIESESFRPDLTRLILADGQIAAYSFNRVFTESNAHRGVREARINLLGTRRPWRRRGLAACLLADSMRHFRAAGYDRATLGVDAANPTGAVALYESVGFEVVRRYTILAKPA